MKNHNWWLLCWCKYYPFFHLFQLAITFQLSILKFHLLLQNQNLLLLCNNVWCFIILSHFQANQLYFLTKWVVFVRNCVNCIKMCYHAGRVIELEITCSSFWYYSEVMMAVFNYFLAKVFLNQLHNSTNWIIYIGEDITKNKKLVYV